MFSVRVVHCGYSPRAPKNLATLFLIKGLSLILNYDGPSQCSLLAVGTTMRLLTFLSTHYILCSHYSRFSSWLNAGAQITRNYPNMQSVCFVNEATT
jgi:hypothetical protein